MGDLGREDPRLGKIPWRRERLPLQCSCLENKIYNTILVSGVVVYGLLAKSGPTLVIPWTVAHQVSLSGFSRREYRSGLPIPSPGDLPDPGI